MFTICESFKYQRLKFSLVSLFLYPVLFWGFPRVLFKIRSEHCSTLGSNPLLLHRSLTGVVRCVREEGRKRSVIP